MGLLESDTTEQLHFQFSLSCIGEGNGNPLQCSCLENPRDGEAWWAAVYGVAQSRTQLKRLSSSSSNISKVLPSSASHSGKLWKQGGGRGNPDLHWSMGAQAAPGLVWEGVVSWTEPSAHGSVMPLGPEGTELQDTWGRLDKQKVTWRKSRNRPILFQ